MPTSETIENGQPSDDDCVLIEPDTVEPTTNQSSATSQAFDFSRSDEPLGDDDDCIWIEQDDQMLIQETDQQTMSTDAFVANESDNESTRNSQMDESIQKIYNLSRVY